jgi:uncharacterized protein (DUF58 family)
VKGALWWAFLIVLFTVATISNQDTLAMLTLMLALTTVVSAMWGRNTLSRVTYRRRPGKANLRYGEETTLVLEITNAKLLRWPGCARWMSFPSG